MIDAELLEILACPETKEAVALAPEEMVADLNEKIRGGSLKNKAGEAIEEELDGGLLRADGRRVYPIRDGIPILLIDEAIEL